MKTQPILLYLAFVITICCKTESATAQINFWEQTNGPIGGHITSLVHNSRGDIFVGTANGIFRSDSNSKFGSFVQQKKLMLLK